jgi:hypothetical protein
VRGSVRKRGETWTWYLWVPDALLGKPRQRRVASQERCKRLWTQAPM